MFGNKDIEGQIPQASKDDETLGSSGVAESAEKQKNNRKEIIKKAFEKIAETVPEVTYSQFKTIVETASNDQDVFVSLIETVKGSGYVDLDLWSENVYLSQSYAPPINPDKYNERICNFQDKGYEMGSAKDYQRMLETGFKAVKIVGTSGRLLTDDQYGEVGMWKIPKSTE